MDNRKATTRMIDDSNRNWKMICLLLPPMIFLTPTSFALFNEPAMLILMKLIAAINKIKTDIPKKR